MLRLVSQLPRPMVWNTIKRTFTLRKYQKECVELCHSKWKEGINKQLVLLPVASGKTLIMAHLIQQVLSTHRGNKKVLVLAHRRELLHQTKQSRWING